MYLGWFDDNPAKPAEHKIAEALAAYLDRFKTAGRVVLVNEAQAGAHIAGVTLIAKGFIRRNNFWVGQEDWQERKAEEVPNATVPQGGRG